MEKRNQFISTVEFYLVNGEYRFAARTTTKCADVRNNGYIALHGF